MLCYIVCICIYIWGGGGGGVILSPADFVRLPTDKEITSL